MTQGRMGLSILRHDATLEDETQHGFVANNGPVSRRRQATASLMTFGRWIARSKGYQNRIRGCRPQLACLVGRASYTEKKANECQPQ